MDYIGILVSVLALRKLAGTVRTTNSKTVAKRIGEKGAGIGVLHHNF